jgi:protein SCO1/2
MRRKFQDAFRAATFTSCVAVACAIGALPVVAQIAKEVPVDLVAVGIDQHLDEPLPLDLRFTDDHGEEVRLGDYYSQGRPVVLNLVYYDCPMLCNIALDGLVQTLSEIDWLPGEQFEIVTVSIDPTESTDLAREKKKSYLSSLKRPGAEAGWHFMTGQPDAIERLADAVGFRYNFLPESGEFAHSAALFVITPEGRIARYLMGVKHDPKTFRLSLVEAADGKIGSAVDQFLLYCYRYNVEDGAYTPVAMRIMRVAGGLTLAVVSVMLVVLWRRDAHKRPGQ